MVKLLITPQAEIDLEKIYDYTYSIWGLAQAEKYQDELNDAMESIRLNPKIGKVYYYKAGNYRKLNINRHLVFYKPSSNECIIGRLLHEKMDLKIQLE